MNRFLGLLISVCGVVTWLSANDPIVNANNEIITQLDAQRVPEDYFANKPDIIFLDSTVAAVFYPQFYPNVAAVFAQALSGIATEAQLYREDVKEMIKGKIAGLQWQLEALENENEMKRRLEQGIDPLFYRPERSLEEIIDDECKKSKDFLEWTNEREKYFQSLFKEQKNKDIQKLNAINTELAKYDELIAVRKNEISLEVARRQLTHHSCSISRERAKKIELLNAEIKLRQLRVNRDEIENAAPAFILSLYGKWNTPKQICQTIELFLKSRNLNYKCYYFANSEVTREMISSILKNETPAIIQIATDNNQHEYLCIVGIDNAFVFTGFIPPNNQEPTIGKVQRSRPDMVYKVKWSSISEKIIGYYIFKKTK